MKYTEQGCVVNTVTAVTRFPSLRYVHPIDTNKMWKGCIFPPLPRAADINHHNSASRYVYLQRSLVHTENNKTILYYSR